MDVRGHVRASLIATAFASVTIVTLSCSDQVCNAFCASSDFRVSSSAGDLVSATACGQQVTCAGSSPCDVLSVPPPAQGGQCSVTVTLSDRSPQTTDVVWSFVGGCCAGYVVTPYQIDLSPPDASDDAAADAVDETD